MKRSLEIETILIDAFGETFLELVLQNKISSEQFKLLLVESQKKINQKFNDRLQEQALQLEHLKAQLRPDEQKN